MKDAREIAARMGLPVPRYGVGITARFWQYVALEGNRLVDQSEKINAQRNKYKPHQGTKERAK